VQVIVDGLLTNYQRTGQGKTVLLLHGWGDSSVTFKRLAADISNNYEFIIPDLPGFGGSQMPPADWGLDEYARFVSQFLLKTNTNPYAVLGHSNGGAIAIESLANSSLDAQKLVLLASAGIRLPKQAVKLTARVGKAVAAPLPKNMKHKLKKRYYGAIGSEALDLPQLEPVFRKIVSQDVQASAKRIKLPALIIYGEKDEATPPVYGDIFHEAIEGSRLELIEGAAHFVHLDAPDKVAHLVKEFLDG
jgi:pimeloyl-ACP methyl ester carboxylesterase